MMIDCGRCDMRGVACQDCVVAVMAPRSAARHLEAEELRALSVLADAGLVPPLRLRVSGPASTDGTGSGGTGPASLPRARTWAFPHTKAS
jgi:hypothetical protein